MDAREQNKTEATRYAGGNERLDNLLIHYPEDEVWIVTGVNGRLVMAGTHDGVIAEYNSRGNKWRTS